MRDREREMIVQRNGYSIYCVGSSSSRRSMLLLCFDILKDN